MIALILLNPDGTKTTVPAHEATHEQLVTWINQAPDADNRNERKAMVHGYVYSYGPHKLRSMVNYLKEYPNENHLL